MLVVPIVGFDDAAGQVHYPDNVLLTRTNIVV